MKDFKKYFIIPAPPDDVYHAITVESTIELWTGDHAMMSPIAGTEFSMWDDSIVGKNLEFETGKKVVQQWYFGEQQEPSIVTIKLHPHEDGTSMEVRHTNIPDDDYEDIADGWTNTYAAGLIEFYEDDIS
ncbi:MAG TPA: SRPBCC domain-containing protein [Cyclobacteriaceae bacterium]|nr:SRPBCC domain-containing protein [Cyclobacteriaceae bacterium]